MLVLQAIREEFFGGGCPIIESHEIWKTLALGSAREGCIRKIKDRDDICPSPETF
ncbi:MAG: hypothetical protein Pars93KO_27580 [Parasphingorhabdus sp.]